MRTNFVALVITILVTGCSNNVIEDGKIIDGNIILSEDQRNIDLNATVAYVANEGDKIKVYGKGTGKTLDIEKCLTGICFTLKDGYRNLFYEYTTLHSNNCNSEFSVANAIELSFKPQGMIELYRLLQGKRYENTLKDIEELNEVVYTYNTNRIIKMYDDYTTVTLPIFVVPSDLILKTVYPEINVGMNKLVNSLSSKENALQLDKAISEAYKYPHRQTLPNYLNIINGKVLALNGMPNKNDYDIKLYLGTYKTNGNISYFDDFDGSSAYNFIESDFAQNNFNCNKE